MSLKNYNNFMDKSIFETEEIHQLAEENFGKFVRLICRLIVTDKIKFDLIIGAGDSGVGMLKFVELIYQQLGLATPKTIQIPIFRFKDPKVFWADSDKFYFDNSGLLPIISEQLKDMNQVQNILFVDDEISHKASTFLTCIKLITQVLDKKVNNSLNCYIVAESHNYKGEQFDPNIKINFFPFSEGKKDIYSVISYIVPWEIEKQIKEQFSEEELNSKRRLNILLGLPIKKRENSKGMFDFKYNGLANEKIKNFKSLQDKFLLFLKELITKNLS